MSVMNKYAKYLILIVASSMPVGAVISLQGIYSCVINDYVSNACDELFMSSIVIFLIFTGFASIGVVLVGLPWFVSLRNEGKDTFLNVVVWPAAAFSFVIFILFGVYNQRSYITFAAFSGFWLFSAATFWYVADKMALTSSSSGCYAKNAPHR